MEITSLLLQDSNQFTFLVGIAALTLTVAILTNRLLDLRADPWIPPDRLARVEWHIVHFSRLGLLQLIVIGLILIRILLSAFGKVCPWFDFGIVAFFFGLWIYWIFVHTKYFKDWYRRKAEYLKKDRSV